MLLTQARIWNALIGAALFTFAASAGAQTVKVDVKGLEVQLQQSPDIEFKGTKDKKWTPKEWLEIETAFKAQSTDRNATHIDELEFHYYVYFDGQKQAQPKVYTRVVKATNIPKDEDSFTISFMTPTTLESVFGVGKGAKVNDIWVAVEVKYRGALVGGDANQGKTKRWWQAGTAQRVEGAVKAKHETPFQFLWYDRHVEEKRER